MVFSFALRFYVWCDIELAICNTTLATPGWIRTPIDCRRNAQNCRHRTTQHCRGPFTNKELLGSWKHINVFLGYLVSILQFLLTKTTLVLQVLLSRQATWANGNISILMFPESMLKLWNILYCSRTSDNWHFSQMDTSWFSQLTFLTSYKWTLF